MLNTFKDQEKILDLYLNQNMPVNDIARELNYKYSQPVVNLLKKLNVYEPGRNKAKTGPKRTYTLNENFFDEINTEAKAYILGFIAADGYISTNKIKRVVIELHEKDKEILEQINFNLESNSPIKKITRKGNYKHVKLSINSAYLVNSLCKYGLTSDKSLNMKNIIQFIPYELQHHFLRGYFDGDGCITYGKKYNSGYKYLVQIVGTKEFLTTSFDKYFDTNCKIYKYKTCNMFCWKIANKKQVDIFKEKLYKDATIFLTRKYKVFI